MPELESPMCAELRSKKYYFLQAPPRVASDLLDASNDCWCARTSDRIGPDHDLVHPDECRSGRTCFRAIFGAAYRSGRDGLG
jgi:hypothetical protein